jgi:hypothetical protein
MEELTATVQQNAAHTAHASTLVADSRTLADRGGSGAARGADHGASTILRAGLPISRA